MPLLTSYAYQDSFFHTLDPRTKLTWLAVILIICFVTTQISLLVGLIAVIAGLSWAARLDLRGFLPMTKIVSSLALGVILIQGIFHAEGEALFSLGPINFYLSGVWLAILVMLRLYCVIFLFLQFLMWTHPTDVSLVLVKARLPYRYAMLMGLALRFFPVLEDELRNIFQAQAARGVELEGSVRKALQLVPIILPFCLRALRRTNEVSLAMELRGYDYRPQRTFLRSIQYRSVDHAMTVLLLVCLIGYLVARAYYPSIL